MTKEQLRDLLQYGPMGSHTPVVCPKCRQETTNTRLHVCTIWAEGTALGPMRRDK